MAKRCVEFLHPCGLNAAPGFPGAENIPEASSASLPHTLLDEL